MRLHRFRRVAARCRSDRGNHEFGVPHRIRHRSGATHRAGFGGAPQLGAGGLREKNVPGGHLRRGGVV